DVFVEHVGDDQHRLETHALELGRGLLGLGRVELEAVDDGDTIFASQLGENRANAGAVHLLVDLLAEVFVRRGGECATASTPDGRGRHAGTSTAGAFLAPRLLGAVLDFGAIFLRTVAAARVGLEGHHDLVYQRFVEVAAEHSVGSGDGGRGLTLVVQELEFHLLGSFLGLRLDGGTHDDVGVLVAGNSAPDQQQSAFCVDTHDVEILDGTGDVTQMAGHFLAGEDAAGILSLADGTGHAVRTGVTVRCALRTEVVALDGSGKALADGGTGYVHLLARFEHAFDGHDGTGREFGGFRGVETEFLEDAAGFNAGFGVMPGSRLADARGAAGAVCYLYRCIPIDFW